MDKLINDYIAKDKVVIFSKSFCPFCKRVKTLFESKNIEYKAYELDLMEEGSDIQAALKEKTNQSTVPNVFINGNHLGGCDDTLKVAAEEKLTAMVNDDKHNYDYDLVVIGGGSGGLSASKEAARLGKKVAVLDFVVPSPPGSTWGLGGTCVNVGCIPKKLMHQAGILGESVKDAKKFGWEVPDQANHNWETMVTNIQAYIKSLNWGYRVALRDKKVKYINEYGSFLDAHTIKTVNKKGKESKITTKDVILATGGRPKYPDIPGAKEYGITSDDIFSLPYNPGKTLFVGASYISLECAGFCQKLNIPSTVMVRSILLRGFDQQIANKIGDYMEKHGVNFIRECVPTKLELIEEGKPGKIKVTGKYNDGTVFEDIFNSVVFAIGRDAETRNIGVDQINLKLNPKNGKVIHNDVEATNVPNVYAIGDMLDDKPELTPVAIQAGKLLARRLCGVSKIKTDYVNIATTVFTPIEYGCVGLSEEDAINKYGEDNIEIYHSNFWPLEHTVAGRPENDCYAKLVCLKKEKEKVVGFHYLGPNAGEVTQGYAMGIRMGVTKQDFDDLIGIHPTTAEIFTTLNITKSSGSDPAASGC